MGKFFGTDGVRGVANLELTPQLAFDLGRFGAFVLTRHTNHTPKILVGKDTRISGDMLECALVAGILSVGANAQLLGVIPTPAVAYLTKKYSADAGVVISASHNSVEYNGIKFFNQDGFKLSDDIESEIEDYIVGKKAIESVPSGIELGRVKSVRTAPEDYVDFVIKQAGSDLSGLTIAMDCANGASCSVAPNAFKRLGAKLNVIAGTPDGTNINLDCGSTHIERLCSFVKETGSDFGLAFDGDADRLIAVDETGTVVDGDVLIALFAMHLKSLGKLENNTVVCTVMSNLGLTKTCAKHDISVLQSKVGDRYVLEKMIETGSVLGGEQSGHIISLRDNTTGDGLISALNFAALIKSSGEKASVLAKQVKILPQVLLNAKVLNEHKDTMLTDPEVLDLITKTEKKYSGIGRLLVRASGTEPVVRIMLEGENIDEMNRDAEILAGLLEAKFSE